MPAKWSRALISVGIGLVIWFIPVPEGVKPQAWKLFAIFAYTITGLLLRPMPMGVIALTGLTAAALLKVLRPGEVVSGFADPIIWLIVCAFLFARGFVKTGLGRPFCCPEGWGTAPSSSATP